MNNKKEVRTRNWFITINQNADCFADFKEKITSIKKLTFAYILHDKDIQTEPHYHCVLKYEDAKTFGMLLKYFKGAHMEPADSLYKCCRYLIHLDDPDKYQYPVCEVVDTENLFGYYVNHDDHLKLDENTLLENVKNGTITNIIDAIKLFGLKQVNLYRNTINEVLNTLQRERDSEFKSIVKAYQSRLDRLAKTNDAYLQLLDEYDQMFSKFGLNI